jgi:hypothetical protein
VSKLAAHPTGDYFVHSLEGMDYHGPSDLIMAANANPYVPKHLKGRAQKSIWSFDRMWARR